MSPLKLKSPLKLFLYFQQAATRAPLTQCGSLRWEITYLRWTGRRWKHTSAFLYL